MPRATHPLFRTRKPTGFELGMLLALPLFFIPLLLEVRTPSIESVGDVTVYRGNHADVIRLVRYAILLTTTALVLLVVKRRSHFVRGLAIAAAAVSLMHAAGAYNEYHCVVTVGPTSVTAPEGGLLRPTLRTVRFDEYSLNARTPRKGNRYINCNSRTRPEIQLQLGSVHAQAWTHINALQRAFRARQDSQDAANRTEVLRRQFLQDTGASLDEARPPTTPPPARRIFC